MSASEWKLRSCISRVALVDSNARSSYGEERSQIESHKGPTMPWHLGNGTSSLLLGKEREVWKDELTQ